MSDSSQSEKDSLVVALEGYATARRDLNFVFASIANAERALTEWKLSLKEAREKEAKARQTLVTVMEVH